MSQEEWQMETASKNEEISRETAEFQFVLTCYLIIAALHQTDYHLVATAYR